MSPVTKKASFLECRATDNLKYFRLIGKTIVVKYGGAALEHQEYNEPTLNDIAFLRKTGANVVVVHGGSRQLDKKMREKGLEIKSIDGLRYTSDETINEAQSVFYDINAQIVKALQDRDIDAVGLRGEEDSVIEATLKNFDTYGYVGDIKNVKVEILEILLSQGKVPVISALGREDNGKVLNINADDVACAVASALISDIFMFITDVEGVLQNPADPLSRLSSIDDEGIENLLKEGVISKGMTPKIKACLRAVKNGVPVVHILSARQPRALITEIIGETSYGTKLLKKK